ncbi:heme ABC exporter ATP-binding protein CcmA [Inquilinus sp. Marseille-Q2685]|uniref:heme ABC exporter ATP-binding protein CcmA n=1 Tax=Inquilinus sp. Marseille-Q2685 TaxID=2866581 RepID=UPI001CE479E6|nr:heme ABC exporter ATP-binding protein CcmA [Inquilinus sp. Marseille-Q2685]
MTAATMPEPILTADGLACLRGGRLVFAGLSFRLGPGEALVLTGPNGSGKSSLLRLVAGLVPAFAGTLGWTGASGSIAYLGHQDAVKPALTVREALRVWIALSGAAAGEGAVDAALVAVGLEELGDLPCRYLSAGQRRRLALARLELGRAALWLLDEPTLGLDAASVARLEGRIARHRASGGLVMLATHVPLALDGARGLALQDYAAEDLPL